jgi:hypothetical protein
LQKLEKVEMSRGKATAREHDFNAPRNDGVLKDERRKRRRREAINLAAGVTESGAQPLETPSTRTASKLEGKHNGYGREDGDSWYDNLESDTPSVSSE